MELDTFSTLTEFSVAIAGFSGIIIAVAGRQGAPLPLVWFRNICLLTWSLCAAFGSVLPPLVANFGIDGASVWAWSSGIFSLMVLALTAVPLLGARRLSSEDSAALSKVMWAIALVGNPLIAISQLVNLAGLFGPPAPGALFAGILWLLVFACMLFGRMLASPPDP
ncbi:MAG: hypothetical protein JRE71_18820 [Deltaproteobacteria bacterium]|nr:hypothetical protein [Deltaproteobacteria bacterium]